MGLMVVEEVRVAEVEREEEAGEREEEAGEAGEEEVRVEAARRSSVPPSPRRRLC